ncbi:MAG TPA: glycosyltransferase family 2 protein [Verrucomicrobiae bacterium]|nr:glycosyltransferase family 2 protein [Verrucomicrobiae bacterium]
MISVTILTKNSARHLSEVLHSVRSFDEVVVLDSGSTDDTLDLASRFSNVKIYTTQFKGFGLLHNEAAALARNNWIFSLDSDEVMTSELVQEIGSLSLDEEAVYSICMHNYYNGKWIRRCGWYPDRHVRFFHRRITRFTENEVHERVLADGLREIALAGPVRHYSFSCVGDFIAKAQLYSDLFARQHQGKKSSSIGKAVRHGLAAFARSFLIKRGFLDGREGFIVSAANGMGTFYKYLKLMEANEKREISNVAHLNVSPGRRPTLGCRQSRAGARRALRISTPPV